MRKFKMVKIDLREEQIQGILDMIESSTIRGQDAENVVELKEALRKGLKGKSKVKEKNI